MNANDLPDIPTEDFEALLAAENGNVEAKLRAMFLGKPEPLGPGGRIPDSWFPTGAPPPERPLFAEIPGVDVPGNAIRRLRRMLGLPPLPLAAERPKPGPTADDLARGAGLSVDRAVSDSSPPPSYSDAATKLRAMFATLPPATRQDLAQMLSRNSRKSPRLMADRDTVPESPTKTPRVLMADEAPSPADLGLTAGDQS